MKKKYVTVTRFENGENLGGYTQELTKKDVLNAIDGEFDSIEDQDVGTKIVLEIVEMDEEDYAKLGEFTGY